MVCTPKKCAYKNQNQCFPTKITQLSYSQDSLTMHDFLLQPLADLLGNPDWKIVEITKHGKSNTKWLRYDLVLLSDEHFASSREITSNKCIEINATRHRFTQPIPTIPIRRTGFAVISASRQVP